MIKELLNNRNAIIVQLNGDNREEFLRQAKVESFVWCTVDKIHITDNIFFNVIVFKNKAIANLSMQTYKNSLIFQSLEKVAYKKTD